MVADVATNAEAIIRDIVIIVFHQLMEFSVIRVP